VNEKLVLLTKGSSAIKCKLQKLVKTLKIEDRVVFAGFKSNPYPYVKHAKLMVLSSAYEGLPTVILESLVLGTPVISTDCESGPREILPQKNLTPVGDIGALARQIKSAMSYIDNYRTDIKKDFLLENSTKKYLALAK
jgi:glycosyltransferase involved in cell wall biosynthesis